MAIEIVDLPINSMVIFQFAMLVHQRVKHKKTPKTPILYNSSLVVSTRNTLW